MLGPVSGIIRRCGLAGEGVAMLKEVCHCGGGLRNPHPSYLRTV
jgi:rRNA maturation protein Nop10